MEGKTDKELIAEFAGWQCDVINGVKIWYRVGVSRSTSPGELKFDSSWDWLMPVVEKIILMSDIEVWERMKVIGLPIGSPIKTVYKAVVEFIKWWNENERK